MTHEEYARHLFDLVPGCAPTEWGPVLLFYSVVHGTSHVLYGGNHAESVDHAKREGEIDRHKTLRTILPKYRTLKRASTDVRYRPWLPRKTEAEVSAYKKLCREILGVCGISVS